VGRPRHVGQRLESDAEVDLLAATIDDGRGPDHIAARASSHRDRLAGRPAGRDDVLDNEYSLTRLESESSPQGQLTVASLGEQRPHPKGTGDLMTDHDAPQRRRHHDARLETTDTLGDRLGKHRGALGVLQYEGALEITRTVQT